MSAPPKPAAAESVDPSHLPILSELQQDSCPLLLFVDRRLPRPSVVELKATQEAHRQQVVTSILESVAAMGMAGGAGLLLLHPFTLMATAVLGAGALTATTLVRLLWGTEDTNEVILRAFSATVYSPTRELTDNALLSFLLSLAGRMDELSDGVRASIQRSEYDENLDVSVLDQGRLHAVVADVTLFLQDVGQLPHANVPVKQADAAQHRVDEEKEGQAEAEAEDKGAQVEPLVVHRLVSQVVSDAMANAHQPGRHRGSISELLVCTTSRSIGLVRLQYDYKWDTKRSCMWRKVDLHMVRSVLWVDNGSDLQRIIHSLVWQLPSLPPMTVVVEEEGVEGEKDVAGDAGDVGDVGETSDEGVVAADAAVEQSDKAAPALGSDDKIHLHVVLESSKELP